MKAGGKIDATIEKIEQLTGKTGDSMEKWEVSKGGQYFTFRTRRKESLWNKDGDHKAWRNPPAGEETENVRE